ncbi:MAG: PLP-dependent aminotransferase family protein [Rhodospirillales bacterium]
MTQEREDGAPPALRLPAVDRRAARPAYRQIYERIRDAILDGDLAPGARLPSTRSLASQLSVARGTVDTAYAMLAGDGYVVGRGPAGTVVAPTLDPGSLDRVRAAAPASAPDAPVRGATRAGTFQMGLPALDLFPRKLWARLAARHARVVGPEMLVYQDARGLPALRAEIATYLRVSRGVACTPGEVFVTAGFQGALGLIAGTLLQPGDAVWVEDPGYFLARRVLERAAARLVPVAVDGHGIDVAAGLARAPAARLVLVTPTHQFPLGATLPLARRIALLSWAASAGAYVVEDDYDSEYQYTTRPQLALKSLDDAGRVIYVGSFSKVLFPGLGLGYIVATGGLADRFAAAAETVPPVRTALHQSVVADFMREGHFSRHIRRMRRLYAERRAALADALAGALDGVARLHGHAGGMHLAVHLPNGSDDEAAVARCRALGLAPASLSACGVGADRPRGLLIGFANVPVEHAAREAALLRRALDGREPV